MTPDRNQDQHQKELIRDRFTRTIEAFGDYAVTYRAQFADRLSELVAAENSDRVVDLACGPGTLALQFARKVRWVGGVDLTPAMLERARLSARADGLENLDLILGDAQMIPIADESLDISITSYSLHHIPDPARVICEMARVVKPLGRIGIIDILAPENPVAAEAANRIEIARDPSHTRSLPRVDIEKMLAAAGLCITASEVHELPRSFDHWLHVAGWRPGDDAYRETRRLMEATMQDDFAGFHPRYAAADAKTPGAAPDIEMVNTAFFLAAEKN